MCGGVCVAGGVYAFTEGCKWVLVRVISAYAGAIIYETIAEGDNGTCDEDGSCPVGPEDENSTDDNTEQAPESSNNPPSGTLPADVGAGQWGDNNGVGKREGKNKFHKSKQDSPWSGGKEDWKVNPDTGDIFDPAGNLWDNLYDID